MSGSVDIFSQALGLPEHERADLARQLLLSLEPTALDSGNDAYWAEEIEVRLAMIERGEFTAIEWREAMARIRESLPRTSSP